MFPRTKCLSHRQCEEPGLCDGCGFYFAWRSCGSHCQHCAGVISKKEVPHIIARTHLVWNKRSFARFHPHKRHLDEASQQPFQCKLQAWIAKHNCTAFAIFQIPSRRNRTRRAHKVSRIVARKLFTRENTGFRAIPSSPAVRSPPSWRSCKQA